MEGYYTEGQNDEYTYLNFYEKKGKLHYKYRKSESIPTKVHTSVHRIYRSEGLIPDEVVVQGDLIIQAYVDKKIAADLNTQKLRFDLHNAFAKDPNIPIKVRHNKILLRGRIISADDSTLRVRLEEPYQNEKFIIYGFGSAMAKHYIFKKNRMEFTNDAIKTAKSLLVRAYEEEKHRQKIKM